MTETTIATDCPNLGGNITADPATFPYGELDCQVKWHIDKWEGGEMWTATSIGITDYMDILVKYYFDASVEEIPTPVPTVEGFPTATPGPTTAGISRMPHGYVPYTLFETPANAEFFNASARPGHPDDVNLPYSCCKGTNSEGHEEDGLKTTTNCADSCMMEQMLMVLYSTDDTATPDIEFTQPQPYNRLVNIRKWEIAEVVPRSLCEGHKREQFAFSISRASVTCNRRIISSCGSGFKRTMRTTRFVLNR